MEEVPRKVYYVSEAYRAYEQPAKRDNILYFVSLLMARKVNKVQVFPDSEQSALCCIYCVFETVHRRPAKFMVDERVDQASQVEQRE